MENDDRFGFFLKTYENFWFWDVEEHHAGVLDTSGPAKLCWHMVRWLQDSSRASKPAPAQVMWHEGQQTCGGAHGIQRRSFGEGKIRFCFLYAPAQAPWQQGQQTCVGAHGIQRRFFGEGKMRFWIPGQTLNDLQSSVLLSAIATYDI